MGNANKSRIQANNSNLPAPVFEWKTLYRRDLAKAQFSESSELYQVTIDGEQWDPTVSNRVRVSITDLYNEHHPYMAIGRAVIRFMESSYSKIINVSISKRR